jgi:hypothetical protein
MYAVPFVSPVIEILVEPAAAVYAPVIAVPLEL